MKKAETKQSPENDVIIKAPNIKSGTFLIRGTTPLVMNKFSNKAKMQMKLTQEAGSTAKTKKVREAKDFKQCYEDSKHISTEGWCGIPASAFRCAMIRACSAIGFKMTQAKMSVFVQADGCDEEGNGLVKITKGNPFYSEDPVRNASGVCDIRARAKWAPGWEAKVTIRWDADQFTLNDVSNLLMRAGFSVGILEGRPFSKDSCGMNWGTFEVIGGTK